MAYVYITVEVYADLYASTSTNSGSFVVEKFKEKNINYLVGFFCPFPSASFVSETGYEDREDAAKRVNFLNGGGYSP